MYLGSTVNGTISSEKPKIKKLNISLCWFYLTLTIEKPLGPVSEFNNEYRLKICIFTHFSKKGKI